MTIQVVPNPLELSPGAVSTLQRTKRGVAFQRWSDELRNLLDGRTPEDQRKLAAANETFIRGLGRPQHGMNSDVTKAVTPTAVHVDALMSTFSVMYANDEYIGERLMPPVTVAKRSNKFATYNKRDRFAFPDDEIGHRAQSNELDEGRSTDNYSVTDYGFKNFLDLETAENEDAPLNEMVDLVESINEGIAFKREKRILTIVTTAGNFGSNTADATTEWDATSPAGGTIVADLLAARSALWQGRNPTMKIGYCPLNVWNTCIANNAAIRDLFKYVAEGLAVTTQVARYFRLDDILITEAREDTANIGQTASYARMVTADVFGIIAAARNPSPRSLHFGSTFRMRGDPYTTQWTDPSVGKRGGIYARVAVSEDHKIVSADAGYLITDAITD